MSSKKKPYLYNLVCLQCAAAFKSKHRLAKFCSIACSNSARGTYRACVTCGTVISPGHYRGRGLCPKCYERSRPPRKRSGKHLDAKEMAKRWREAHRQRRKEQTYEYRARKRNAFVQKVYLDAIYKRDKGRCQICGEKVSRDVAGLDHIIPLARGGLHERRNVQIAHPACNSRRQARLPAQTRLW